MHQVPHMAMRVMHELVGRKCGTKRLGIYSGSGP